jgi:hypothetical protein
MQYIIRIILVIRIIGSEHLHAHSTSTILYAYTYSTTCKGCEGGGGYVSVRASVSVSMPLSEKVSSARGVWGLGFRV